MTTKEKISYLIFDLETRRDSIDASRQHGRLDYEAGLVNGLNIALGKLRELQPGRKGTRRK